MSRINRRWNVIARAFTRITGKEVGKERVELVNTDNVLFKNCVSILDVKEAYERFWNDLNSESAHVVFVSQVIPL